MRLYQSVQAALQDGGKDGWQYEQVLSDLRALLDAEAAESGEDVNGSTPDKLGEIVLLMVIELCSADLLNQGDSSHLLTMDHGASCRIFGEMLAKGAP